MTNFVTPVGRIVQGDAFKPNTTNQQGQPLTDKHGQPRVEYYLALAIEKTNPDWPAFKAQLDQVAAQAWPGGQFNAPLFSNKITDGDGLDNNGVLNSTKEGFAGCWVLKASNGFAPQRVAQAGAVVLNEESGQLKRGDYARLAVTASGNNNQQKPGIYVNLNIIEFIGFGEAIVGGPDASELLGAVQPAHMPAGISQTPVAPQAQPQAQPMQPQAQPMQPQAQPMQPQAQPMQPQAQPMQPQAQPMQTMQPQAQPVAPHQTILNPQQ